MCKDDETVYIYDYITRPEQNSNGFFFNLVNVVIKPKLLDEAIGICAYIYIVRDDAICVQIRNTPVHARLILICQHSLEQLLGIGVYIYIYIISTYSAYPPIYYYFIRVYRRRYL